MQFPRHRALRRRRHRGISGSAGLRSRVFPSRQILETVVESRPRPGSRMHSSTFPPFVSKKLQRHRGRGTGCYAVVCERQLAAAARTGEAPGPNDRPAIALIGWAAGSEPRKRGQLGRLVAVCDVDAKAAPWRRRSSRRGPAAPKIIPISGNCSSAPISRARPLHHGSLAPAREPRRRAREEGHLSENRSRSPSRRPGVAIPSKRAASCCRPARSRQLARFGSVRTRAQRRIGKLTTADVWLRRAARGPLSESGPEGLNWDYWPGQAPPSIVQQRCLGNFASGMFTRRP